MSGPIANQDLAVIRSFAARGNKEARILIRVFDTLRASDSEVIICRAATTADRALTGLTNSALDGVTPLDSEVILVKAQTDASENGPYLAHASAWTRVVDDKGDVMMRAGQMVQVTEGTTLADTQWVVTTDDPIVVDTDDIAWARNASAITDSLIGDDLGAPDLIDDNRFLLSVIMQATAYTLDETTLPADNPPRNVIITHTTDTTTDTLGDAVVDGTDFNDAVIQETITVVADGIATGVKAFKTVTAVTTASWVQVGGVSDLLEVGFGNLLGLSNLLTAASQVFLATLAGLARLPDSITVSASLIEQNTISLDGGTYDSSKVARALLKL